MSQYILVANSLREELGQEKRNGIYNKFQTPSRYSEGRIPLVELARNPPSWYSVRMFCDMLCIPPAI